MLYRTASLAALLSVLAFAAPAQADTSTTSPMVTTFVKMGERFWHERGVYPCPSPIVVREDLDSQNADGAASTVGECRIWISGYLIQAANEERWRPRTFGDSIREDLCTTVFHELGHTAGLGHTATGLMSPNGAVVPGDCHAWVQRQYRLERRAFMDRRRGVVRMSG